MREERARFLAGIGGTIGIFLAFFGFLLISHALHFPITTGKVLGVAWVCIGAASSIGLLLYAGGSKQGSPNVLLMILVAGDLVASITIIVIPLAIIWIIWPVIGGAVIIDRNRNGKSAVIFVLIPLLAFLFTIMFQ